MHRYLSFNSRAQQLHFSIQTWPVKAMPAFSNDVYALVKSRPVFSPFPCGMPLLILPIKQEI